MTATPSVSAPVTSSDPASDAILVLNTGSSSLKFALYAITDQACLADTAVLHGLIDGLGNHPGLKVWDSSNILVSEQTLRFKGDPDKQQHQALAELMDWLHNHEQGWRILAVGHRVVHGGRNFSRPVIVTQQVLAELGQLIPLAPLHQPHNLAGIVALLEYLPGVPQIACFDTAFHTTQEEVAQAFALPAAITALGVQRYGFHGLSYEYIARQLPAQLGDKANGRVIVAHLGNGASVCAIKNGRSVATSMGFTALDGLMMGTRCGNLDPGVVLYMMDSLGMDSKTISHLLYQESGLLGVSGISGDMRDLLTLAATEASAAKAIKLFCYRLIREIGSLAAALQGLDALVFTGGIGEHAAEIRQQVCQALGWLGIAPDGKTSLQYPTPALVIATNEEWMIAQHSLAMSHSLGPACQEKNTQISRSL